MQLVVGGQFGLTNPVVFDFTSGANALVTAPAGAQNVQIEVWGAGGGGSHGLGTSIDTYDYGIGGASGGYSRSNYAISTGQTLHYSVGAGGQGEPAGDNTDYGGGQSNVTSGTLAITTMTANGGGGSDTGGAGAGGTVAGGNAANTAGNASGTPVQGLGGNTGGAGGAPGFKATGAGKPGGVGRVIFTFT